MDIEAGPVAPPRPKAWLALGIIGIVWGAMAALGTVWNLVAPLITRAPNPMTATGLLQAWFILSSVLTLAAAIALIVGGVGLVRNRAGGRVLALAWAWTQVVLVPLGAVIALANLDAMLAVMVKDLQRDAPRVVPYMRIAVIVGTLIGVFFSLALPVVMLLLLRRRPPVAVLSEASPVSGRADDGNPYRAPNG